MHDTLNIQSQKMITTCTSALWLSKCFHLLFRHVFHKMCVDPWLNEHCTCPMCKLNILKALGVMVSAHAHTHTHRVTQLSL